MSNWWVDVTNPYGKDKYGISLWDSEKQVFSGHAETLALAICRAIEAVMKEITAEEICKKEIPSGM